MPQVCRKLGVTEQTYYRWRKEYVGIRTDQAKRLKELEKENARLKKLVAEFDRTQSGECLYRLSLSGSTATLTNLHMLPRCVRILAGTQFAI